MPDPDEQRRFEEIVAPLRPQRPRRRPRGRFALPVGIALCVVALLLITLGGVRGAVIAVLPWLLGIILVIRGRTRQ